MFNIFEGKVVDLCVALSKILDGKILSLILVICGKKEDNATIYQVTEIKQKLKSLLWIHVQDLISELTESFSQPSYLKSKCKYEFYLEIECDYEFYYFPSRKEPEMA